MPWLIVSSTLALNLSTVQTLRIEKDPKDDDYFKLKAYPSGDIPDGLVISRQSSVENNDAAVKRLEATMQRILEAKGNIKLTDC